MRPLTALPPLPRDRAQSAVKGARGRRTPARMRRAKREARAEAQLVLVCPPKHYASLTHKNGLLPGLTPWASSAWVWARAVRNCDGRGYLARATATAAGGAGRGGRVLPRVPVGHWRITAAIGWSLVLRTAPASAAGPCTNGTTACRRHLAIAAAAAAALPTPRNHCCAYMSFGMALRRYYAGMCCSATMARTAVAAC